MLASERPPLQDVGVTAAARLRVPCLCAVAARSMLTFEFTNRQVEWPWEA
jgi:hypothetical protein